jgi:alkylation response protein AidB-like acyl-CoA dehydrogenase
MTVDDMLQSVEAIRPILIEEAPKCEQERRVTTRAFQALRDAGVFRLHAPKRFGGLEAVPAECLTIWEAIGRIDASIGWNAFMTHAGVPPFAAWLPESGVQEIFGEGMPVMAGVFAPPLQTEKVEGGWRVTGTAPFGSGCHNADWYIVPTSHETRPVFVGFIRAADGFIKDTWHTLGMRGTGSADFGANGAFVPEHLTADPGPLTNPAPGMDGPLFRMWPWAAILGQAVTSVAVAANAVEAAVEVCKKKTPNYQQAALQDQQLAQFLLGKAAALVEASRDTLHRSAEFAYKDVCESGKTLSNNAKIRVQLAASYAGEACAEATRLVNDVVGTAAIRLSQPFERYFRDAHTLIHHAANSNRRYVDAGKLMLGLQTDWIFLIF